MVSAGRGFQFIEIGSNRNASSGGPALRARGISEALRQKYSRKGGDAIAQIVISRFVLDDVGRAGPFLSQGHLAAFARSQIIRAPSPMVHDPIQPGLMRGFDEDHGIAGAVLTGFEQKWGVEHDAGGICIAGELLGLIAREEHHRVKEGFQPLALLGVLENDRGDGLSIEVAVPVEHFLAPPVHECVANRDGGEGLTDLGIEIDHQPADRRELGGDPRLARPDPADDAEDKGTAVGSSMSHRNTVPCSCRSLQRHPPEIERSRGLKQSMRRKTDQIGCLQGVCRR